MDEFFIIVLEVELANIMEVIYPSTYREYVSIVNNGINIINVRLQKVLYGYLHIIILFCSKLKGELEVFGFLLNPNDACIDNK